MSTQTPTKEQQYRIPEVRAELARGPKWLQDRRHDALEKAVSDD